MSTLFPSPVQEALNAQTAFIKSVELTVSRGAESVTLIPESGQVTMDSRRSMRWTGQMSIPVETDLLPTTPEDLLTPFGTTVAVSMGVILAAGVEASVPYGLMIVDASDVQLSGDSRLVSVSLIDLADQLAQYRFESPFTIPSGTDLGAAINMVVFDRLGINPGVADTGNITGRPRVFGLEPALDPWRELETMAEDFGYRIWYDRIGQLRLTQPLSPDPSNATSLGGELTVTGRFDHRPANVVVARGEATSGAPVQSVIMDDDSLSPTYAGTNPGDSPYGRITKYFASPLLTTQGQADQAAAKILADSAGQAATWSVSKAFDPTVDPEDILSVPLDADTSLPLLVDAITCDVTGPTTIMCRAISTLQ